MAEDKKIDPKKKVKVYFKGASFHKDGESREISTALAEQFVERGIASYDEPKKESQFPPK